MKKIKQTRITYAVIAVLIALVGVLGYDYYKNNFVRQMVVVWTTSDTFEAPRSLIKYLKGEYGCHDSLGTGTGDTEVSLYAITDVVDGKFARVSLGCSTNIDPGFPALFDGKSWKLYSIPEYYLNLTGEVRGETARPRCSIVDRYQIPDTFEQTCLEDEGKSADYEYKESDVRSVKG